MDVIRMFAKLYETPYEEMRGFVTCTSGIHDVFVNHAVICIYTLKSHSNFCVFLLSHKSFLIKKKLVEQKETSQAYGGKEITSKRKATDTCLYC